MHARTPIAIALMGPTASGKTALAADWAERLGTEVVSVDSALVYRGMDIGTAKPDAALLARAPHRLIDIRDPHEAYSAAEFAVDAAREMEALHDSGCIPLLAGGTGLYFRALLDGLSAMPSADPVVREAIADEAREAGWESMHRKLAKVDPVAAGRIHPNDPQRISRALEVWRISGRPISDWQGERPVAPSRFRVLKLALAPAERAVLHQRIAERFDQMLEQGFLDEVRRLREDPRLHPDLPSMRAVGYRQAWAHLAGDLDAEQFRSAAIAATRQLAKRQLTWLRGQPGVTWVDPVAARPRADALIGRYLGTA
ncbi:tRNA (adenosine(37)-N6)-dimethylallyltransferase MiaA [Alkalisalibacterium limincola]|uniref:tRNA dimethylallyltransferase n=2 Tax=Alkalisalibacterium limincola TaxID=2699169 RepID=A0A5C8L0K4_9GAMM|nr:tRNA (adenosine(37)-N6)-dimethylallyltransferase MiaA [Alkalisalibacterium limincola]